MKGNIFNVGGLFYFGSKIERRKQDMMDKNAIDVKQVTTAIPLFLHKELRQIAAEAGMSMTRFFRETLIDRLEKERSKVRRRRA